MENSTKVYIGVGAAALIAFFLFRKKVAQKPATKTGGTAGGTTAGGGTAGGGTTAGGTTGGGTVPPVRGVDFPACPEGKIRFPNGECLPIDSEPPARTPPATAPDPTPAPDFRATPSPYRPNDYTEYDVDNTYLRERDSYYKDIFQKKGGDYNVSF
jgi:hypothetical protein